ncbi:MAG: TlpA family protein disulfide reductase [Acidimicrobiia bacterium]|nr:TlpA family protein disulfide reductase [Acidimicrobiia bacterium]
MSRLVITRKQRYRIVGASLGLLIAAVVAVSALGGARLTDEDGDLPTASFALFDGGDATFGDFGGKPLVVNFWASWCPACVAELPEIQDAHELYGDEVTIVGLANTDDRGAATELAGDVGLTYTLADDPTGDLFRSLDLLAMPSTVFITADGEIQEVFGGLLTESALAERIDDLIEAS